MSARPRLSTLVSEDRWAPLLISSDGRGETPDGVLMPVHERLLDGEVLRFAATSDGATLGLALNSNDVTDVGSRLVVSIDGARPRPLIVPGHGRMDVSVAPSGTGFVVFGTSGNPYEAPVSENLSPPQVWMARPLESRHARTILQDFDMVHWAVLSLDDSRSWTYLLNVDLQECQVDHHGGLTTLGPASQAFAGSAYVPRELGTKRCTLLSLETWRPILEQLEWRGPRSAGGAVLQVCDWEPHDRRILPVHGWLTWVGASALALPDIHVACGQRGFRFLPLVPRGSGALTAAVVVDLETGEVHASSCAFRPTDAMPWTENEVVWIGRAASDVAFQRFDGA